MRTCFICGCELSPATAVWLKVPGGLSMFCKPCAKLAKSSKVLCSKCDTSAFCVKNIVCQKKKLSIVGDLDANQTV